MDNQIVVFKDGALELDVKITPEQDTVWLSLEQLADLFEKNKSTISRHIKNIFTEGELFSNSVVANFATTASDGKTYNVSEWCVIQKWEADYQRKHSGSNHTIDSGI
ncbi:MAG: hypothetical protein IJP51_01905 [Acidaminococcaceae bacterium]|nr:hypothetical protein [Acidaminococcaceae bacterium]